MIYEIYAKMVKQEMSYNPCLCWTVMYLLDSYINNVYEIKLHTEHYIGGAR